MATGTRCEGGLNRAGFLFRRLSVAAAACLAAGVTGGVWLSSGSGGRPATMLTFAGTDSVTHVSATLRNDILISLHPSPFGKRCGGVGHSEVQEIDFVKGASLTSVNRP